MCRRDLNGRLFNTGDDTLTTEAIDCKTTVSGEPGTPYYHPCFEFKKLPDSFEFEAGPLSPAVGSTECPRQDKGPFRGQLVRQSPCGFVWASNTPSWGFGMVACDKDGTGNRPPLSHTVNQDSAGMATFWRVIGESHRDAASCTFNPATGRTIFEIRGVWSDDVCQGPFRIWFEG